MASLQSASAFTDDEIFDFDGEADGETALTGAKREFADLDGDDDEELYPSKKIYASHCPSSDHATSIMLNLRSSLEDRDNTIATLKASLDAANGEVEKWTSGFSNDALLPCGVTPDPAVVVKALQKLQASESQLKEQLLAAKRREGVIVVKLASTEQEVVDLKSTVHDLKLMSKPSMQQTCRLLWDPAIHAEFTRMKEELEAAERRVKELQDDLAAVQFDPHSKHGKLFMAKCRTLQEENTEIGREASEGKVHELGTRLAVQKSVNAELRRCFSELYETVEEVSYELERSQQTDSCACPDIRDMETSLAGVKRDISYMEDAQEDFIPTKKIKGSVALDNAHCTSITMNPLSSSEERDITIAALKTSLIDTHEELQRWKHAFNNHSILPRGMDPDPTMVVQAIQKLQASEVQLQEQLLTARKREGVMLFNLANSEQEISNLKSTVRSLKRLSKRSLPSMARPLLPKPSNFDEFSRWKKEIDPAEKIPTELPDYTASVPLRPQAMHDRDLDAECSAVSTETLVTGCDASEGNPEVEDGLRLISGPPLNSKKKVGRPRKYMVAKEEEEGEEGKKNWMDSEVEMLISLRWEMEPDFLKNAYKQGVDMWAQLQARMSSAIPGFSRSGLACQRKFNSLIKQHKKDILEVKEGKHHTWDRHARKFFDSLDRWWHTNGTIMKFSSTKSNNLNSRFDGEAAQLRGNKEHCGRVKEDDEGEEAKKNWLDSEVETMVSLRWEMELDFVDNAYKPGEDMWSKLQNRMMSLIPGFSRSSLACQRKFNALIKQHKKDVLDQKEFGRDHHSYKFYDILDRWWHTNGTVMKHVTASLNESESLGNHSEYMEVTNKFLGEEDEEEGEESKKNWADSEVETLIALRREMDSEFLKNWKKQGGNMWSKLRSRMLSVYPGFSRSPVACKRKFNTLVRQHKKDMHALDASGEERHNCKHHGLMDQWLLNHNGFSGRHHRNCSSNSNNINNTASRSDPEHGEGSLVRYEGEEEYDDEEERDRENGDSIFGSLTKMVQAGCNGNLALEMAKSSCTLLDKMDEHLDNLKLTVSK